MIDFNINHNVHVKLTDIGKAELKRQHEELYSSMPKPIRTDKFELPKEDGEGWGEWQMWVLMSSFGHMLNNGSAVPFETAIRIEDA